MPPLMSEEEKEKWYWENWLDPESGRELIKVREAVERIFEEAKTDPPLAFFTPHGPEHARAVEGLIHRLIPRENYQKLRRMERFCLLTAAWLHDVGMLRRVAEYVERRALSDEEVRRVHHLSSQTFIINQHKRCGLQQDCADVVGLISKFHRKQEDLTNCPERVMVRGEDVRVRLLSAYLRLADALDVGQGRVPEEAYAICLAYDIPGEVKLHWIKNKLVNVARIRPDTHDITLEFRIPSPQDLGAGQSRNWVLRRVESVKALVCDDLREELLSVQSILRKEPGGLPFYLDVNSDQFETVVDSQLLNDLRALITNYDIMVFPTASKLMEMILVTAANILGFSLDEKKDQPVAIKDLREPPNRLKRIEEFLTTAKRQILSNRPSHLGVKRLLEALETARNDLPGVEEVKQLEQLAAQILGIYKEHRHSRRRVREQAMLFFEDRFERADYRDREFNILLYGNSELVTKALCGFRDALLRAGGEMNPLDVANSEAERRASQRLRLFVCEAQPKTQTSIGDRLTYHDGAQYSLHLKRYGFTNLIVIPDVIAGHVLQHIPVDFVVLGADGVTPGYFMHSAGHSSIVSLAWECRASGAETECGKATIVLVTSHQKWVEKPESDVTEPHLTNETVLVDGCLFWRGLLYGSGSNVVRAGSREHVWIARDPEVLKKLCSEGIAFFNPKGDIIPINRVDFIITDKGSKSLKDPGWKWLF